MAVINERRLGLGSYGVSTNGITVSGTTRVYNTIAQRNADTNSGMFAFVRDASDDPTVKSGFAIYYKKSTGWKKIFEEEAMDRDISELVKIQWENVVGTPESPAEDIDRTVQLVTSNQNTLEHIHLRDADLYFDEVVGGENYAHVVLKDRHVKWLQLVRPIIEANLYCEIKIYDNPGLEGNPSFRLNSYDFPSNFYYYDYDSEHDKILFTQLSGTRYIPNKTIGNFVIADISSMLSTNDAYIVYTWYTLDAGIKRVVSTNICVYPALTPTNSYSVGMDTLNWSNLTN